MPLEFFSLVLFWRVFNVLQFYNKTGLDNEMLLLTETSQVNILWKYTAVIEVRMTLPINNEEISKKIAKTQHDNEMSLYVERSHI